MSYHFEIANRVAGSGLGGVQMPQPKLEVVTTGRFYRPVLSELERRAYQAAHLIASADFQAQLLACPGGQRTRKIDTIARLIIQTFDKNARTSR